jgi:hypothetical protein
MAKSKEPRLVLEWDEMIREINRQLKPHNLKVKYKTNYKKWGDQIQLFVVEMKGKPDTMQDLAKIYDEFRAS